MQNLEREKPAGISEHPEVTKSEDIPTEPRVEQPGQIPENPPFKVLYRPWPNRRPRIPRTASRGRRGR